MIKPPESLSGPSPKPSPEQPPEPSLNGRFAEHNAKLQLLENDHAASDSYCMQLAIEQAALAADLGEVPVGAVLVLGNQLIAADHNQLICNHDPSGHAEVRVLRAAAAAMGNYRLPGAKLYVTLEPCVMCVGAIVHARIEQLVFGAADPKTGMAGSVADLFNDLPHNHYVQQRGGVLAEQCRQQLQQFFKQRRAAAKRLKLAAADST